jgi:methyl-accepting chemotaxis protein
MTGTSRAHTRGLGRRLLAPATHAIGRLRYAYKFAVIGVVILATLGFVGLAYLNEVSTQIDFSAKERVGVVYVAPSARLVEALVGLRSAVAARDSARIATAGAAVRAAVNLIDAADRTVGSQLGVSQEWAKLRPVALSLSHQGTGALGQFDAGVTSALTLVTDAGNNSNLILDPDLDSFYVMDEWITKLPPLLDTAGKASNLLRSLTATANPGLQRRITLALEQGSISTNLNGINGDLTTAFAHTSDHGLKPALAPPLAALNTAVNAFSQQLQTSTKSGKAGPEAAALFDRVLATGTQLETQSGPWLDRLLAARVSRLNAAERRVEIIALIGILILAYLFAGFYASVTSSVKDVLRRLRGLDEHDLTDLSGGLQAIASGDLTVAAEPTTQPIEHHTRDELGEIAETFNQMLVKTQESFAAYGDMRDQLVGMLGQISTSSDTVSSASHQIASTSEQTGRTTGEVAHAVGDIAQGAERQVAKIAEVKDTAKRVAGAVSQSSEDMSATAAAVRGARELARGGDEAAGRASTAMESVRGSSDETIAAMDELAAKSEQIGEIVRTITAIAEQTNLLALNAAIEAARAGEHGRGFAVVAEEVRSRAEESHRATDQISTVISQIQAETGKAATVVRAGAARTEEGVTVVEEARAAFAEIADAVDLISERIEQIAQTSSEIVGGVEAVQAELEEVASLAENSSASTEEVSASTDETAASAEQIAATAQELSGNAEALTSLLSRFTLKR